MVNIGIDEFMYTLCINRATIYISLHLNRFNNNGGAERFVGVYKIVWKR